MFKNNIFKFKLYTKKRYLNKCKLFVADPPEISVERPVVHSAEGYEAQLVCIVHGESQPEVSAIFSLFASLPLHSEVRVART